MLFYNNIFSPYNIICQEEEKEEEEAVVAVAVAVAAPAAAPAAVPTAGNIVVTGDVTPRDAEAAVKHKNTLTFVCFHIQ